MKTPESQPVYARRRVLRAVEGWWTSAERALDRLTRVGLPYKSYNPLYHLGTLAIFLLILLTATGIYLTILYRPGTERAYESVAALSSGWFGSLMRTMHRYAADGLVIVVLMHAFKTLISDRFWGSRWLAWMTGWGMLAIVWTMGLTGYWLVWDKNAQWLTEYFINFIRGPFAHSILGPNIGAATYALFVIVLFLHVFIPPFILVAVLIHALRLARTRYWAPRWLMIVSTVTLILVALWRPVSSALPADLGHLVTSVRMDWLYLGFLPLGNALGPALLWGGSLVLLVLALTLPWLARGRHEGPAEVIDANCTGCAICARECPYDAIDMVARDDESTYSSLAIVTANKCTGCGICVGACHDDAIELDRLPSIIVRQDLRRTVAQTELAGEPAITVYACDRQAALGTLPPLLEMAEPAGGSIPLLQAKLPPRINRGAWRDNNGERHPVITAVIPCMGMLHPNWAASTIEAGGAGVIVVGCPANDCAHREGPHWVADRLKRRRTFRRGDTHFITVAPGSRREMMTLWEEMAVKAAVGPAEERAATTVADRPETAVGSKAPAITHMVQLRTLLPGFVLLLVLYALGIVFDQPAQNMLPEQGQLRLVLNHGGQLIAASEDLPPDVLTRLPDNVDPAMVLGGERFPISLRVIVDGAVVLDAQYNPRGLRREGAIYAQEQVWLSPGAYDVSVSLQDDGTNWRELYNGTVDIGPTEARTLMFDDQAGVFELR